MSRKSQLEFLTKLSTELERDSEEYRKHTANKETHHFTLTQNNVEIAIQAVIHKYFPEAGRESKVRAMEQLKKPITDFITSVGNKIRARSKTSEGIHTIITSPTKVSAIFQGTGGGNRYEKAYNMYAREEKFVKTLTEEVHDTFQTEFGRKPEKVIKAGKNKGKTKELEAGDIFNLEHQITRGVVESLVRDAIDNAAVEGENFGRSELEEFCKNFDINFSIIRDTKTNTMNVFVGSKIINLEEGSYSLEEKQKLEKAVATALKKLEEIDGKLSYLPGSPSFADIKEMQGVNTILKKFKDKGFTVSGQEKITHSKTKVKKKVQGVRGAKSPLKKKQVKKRRGTRTATKSPASSQLQLVANLNKGLPARVKKNMNLPALENRTGRFAESVKVTEVMQTQKGFPSVGYTYDRDNYGQFEATSGSKSYASHQRDPRKLIDKSIRELATTMAIGRFFTRRV